MGPHEVKGKTGMGICPRQARPACASQRNARQTMTYLGADNPAVAVLALLLCPSVGNSGVLRALAAARHLGRPLDAVLDMAPQDLLDALPPGLSTVAEVAARCSRAQRDHAEMLFEKVTRMGGRFLVHGEDGYPEGVTTAMAANAPALLTILADPMLLGEHAVAIVGAREVSSQGAQLAAECARVFSMAGVTVVSGGARGVDVTAHAAALAAGGKTVVVLPQGVLTYRPLGELHEAMQEGHATVLSQFVPDAPWETHAAVTRNATISALAHMVCVIEPKKRGGSIRTARHALSQGKRLLVHWGEGLAASAQAAALTHAGALDVLETNASFSQARLLELWQTAPEPPRGQGDLFESPHD